MTKQPPPLTALTETQRAQAYARFTLLRPFLQERIPLPQIARQQSLPLRTLRRWVRQYREYGLAGLLRQPRSDRGQRRGLPADLKTLIEGLALQKPKRSIAAIHRHVTAIAATQGWKPPSYSRVYRIVHALDPNTFHLRASSPRTGTRGSSNRTKSRNCSCGSKGLGGGTPRFLGLCLL
jgi:putative transposase